MAWGNIRYSQSFNKEIYNRREKPHQCTQCPAAFAQLTDLRKHFKVHTVEQPQKMYYQALKDIIKFIKIPVIN